MPQWRGPQLLIWLVLLANLHSSSTSTPRSCANATNLALESLGASATASASSQDGAAREAIDSNSVSRWAILGNQGDNQWLSIQLPGTYVICRAIVNWEAAYAANYGFSCSSDGTTFTPVITDEAATSEGEKKTSFPPDTVCNYVRLDCVTRGPYGFSVWALELYGFQYTSGTDSLAPSDIGGDCHGKPCWVGWIPPSHGLWIAWIVLFSVGGCAFCFGCALIFTNCRGDDRSADQLEAQETQETGGFACALLTCVCCLCPAIIILVVWRVLMIPVLDDGALPPPPPPPPATPPLPPHAPSAADDHIGLALGLGLGLGIPAAVLVWFFLPAFHDLKAKGIANACRQQQYQSSSSTKPIPSTPREAIEAEHHRRSARYVNDSFPDEPEPKSQTSRMPIGQVLSRLDLGLEIGREMGYNEAMNSRIPNCWDKSLSLLEGGSGGGASSGGGGASSGGGGASSSGGGSGGGESGAEYEILRLLGSGGQGETVLAR